MLTPSLVKPHLERVHRASSHFSYDKISQEEYLDTVERELRDVLQTIQIVREMNQRKVHSVLSSNKQE